MLICCFFSLRNNVGAIRETDFVSRTNLLSLERLPNVAASPIIPSEREGSKTSRSRSKLHEIKVRLDNSTPNPQQLSERIYV